MQALVLNRTDAPLDYQTVEKPVADTGEVVVKLQAAALNHRDLWITKGQYAGIKFPTILGSDGAGTLDGKEVIISPSMEWGDNPRFQQKEYNILGLPLDGTFAEYVKVPESQIYPKPAHLSVTEAAALPLAGLTAYRALFTKCTPQPGEKVLISGVGGGVAQFAFQFAVAAGMEVYVTSGSAEKIERAKATGAKDGLDYRRDKLSKEIKEMTGGGVDVIIDSAAGNGFAELVKSCNPGGRICFYGATRGNMNNLDPRVIFWKQLSIFGSTMGTNEEFADMLAFVEKHEIVPVVDEVFSLENGNAALEKMARGGQFGKLVLEIG